MEQKKDQSGAAVRGEAVAETENKIQHDSDCSLHNMPAYPAGPCDCTAKKVKPDFATDEEWLLMGRQVEGSQNGIDWFAGELVEIIDLFAPYRVNIDGEPLLFQQIRPVIKVSARAADALDSQPHDVLAENILLARHDQSALDSQPTEPTIAPKGLFSAMGLPDVELPKLLRAERDEALADAADIADGWDTGAPDGAQIAEAIRSRISSQPTDGGVRNG